MNFLYLIIKQLLSNLNFYTLNNLNQRASIFKPFPPFCVKKQAHCHTPSIMSDRRAAAFAQFVHNSVPSCTLLYDELVLKFRKHPNDRSDEMNRLIDTFNKKYPAPTPTSAPAHAQASAPAPTPASVSARALASAPAPASASVSARASASVSARAPASMSARAPAFVPARAPEFVSASTSAPASKPKRPCRFGDKCRGPDCAYWHPNQRLDWLMWCKFNKECKKPTCSYRHETKSTEGGGGADAELAMEMDAIEDYIIKLDALSGSNLGNIAASELAATNNVNDDDSDDDSDDVNDDDSDDDIVADIGDDNQ